MVHFVTRLLRGLDNSFITLLGKECILVLQKANTNKGKDTKMGRPKKEQKLKEPVKIRQRKLANGNISLYLDIYSKGVRKYETLNLFVVPGNDPITKVQNHNSIKVANEIKAQRILALQNKGIRNWEKVKKEHMPLVSFLKEYENYSFGFSKSTLDGRKEMRLKVEDFLEETGQLNLTVNEIDEDFCKNFIRFLTTSQHGVIKKEGTTISKGAAYHHQGVFNGAINKAVRDGILASNPMKNLTAKEKLQPSQSLREFLTIEEVKKLKETPCPNAQVKTAFLFSCFTGLRLSDVLQLTWNKILKSPDGKTLFVSIEMQKTDKPINLPLSEEATKCLYKKEKKDEPIFTLPQTPTIEHDIKKWIKVAGIDKHITYHCSRHTFATMMLTLGADIYTVSKLLGHATVTTTQVYAQIIDQKKVDTVNLVDNLF